MQPSYTQFFTAVEIGDCDEVSYHIGRGLDPMKNYRMDGKLTCPIKSALSKGDVKMTHILLNSNKVRLTVSDVLQTSKNMPVDSSLINKLASVTEITSNNQEEEFKKMKATNGKNRNANYNLAEKVISRKLALAQTEDDDADEEERGEDASEFSSSSENCDEDYSETSSQLSETESQL